VLYKWNTSKVLATNGSHQKNWLQMEAIRSSGYKCKPLNKWKPSNPPYAHTRIENAEITAAPIIAQ